MLRHASQIMITSLKEDSRREENTARARELLPTDPPISSYDPQGPREQRNFTTTFPSRVNPFVQRGKLFDLPIILNGVRVVSIPDTGARINAISVSTLKAIKAQTNSQWGNPDDNVYVGNDTSTGALCQVRLDCKFPPDEYATTSSAYSSPETQTFHVFAALASGVAAIMGWPFLEATQTLTTYAHRFTERTISGRQNPRCMSIGPLEASGLRLKVYLDSRLISATPDTGSEINLISTRCVKRHGFRLEPLHHGENRYVEFADGQIGTLSGKIRAKFDCYKDPVRSGTAADLQRSNNYDGNPRHRHNRNQNEESSSSDPDFDQYKTFYVLGTLADDLILSQSLLHSIDAWNLHASSFESVSVASGRNALNTIFWYKGKRYQAEESSKQNDPIYPGCFTH
jgi:hypothetical protein